MNGIPAILAYKKGNINYIPDDMTAGADMNQTNAFFMRAGDFALILAKAAASAKPLVTDTK